MGDDRSNLLSAALKYSGIKGSGYLRKLLQYLDKNYGTELSADDIWEEVFEEDTETNHLRLREVASRLRRALEEVALAGDSDYYRFFPEADDRDDDGRRGYRLILKRRGNVLPTDAFWRVHSASDNVKLVYSEPIFYYDPKNAAMIRFLDTNPRTVDREPATAELRSKHGQLIEEWYGNTAYTQLRPTRVFVGIGDMEAMERLSFWFRKHAHLNVERVVSDRFPSLQGGCPILIGNERTNRFVDYCLDSAEGRVFCYRFKNAPISYAEIRGITQAERARLDGLTILSDGATTIVGQDGTQAQLRDRIVVVTRMPLPGGKGATTMFGGDSTLAIREAVCAFTDERQLGKILKESGLDQKSLPERFEFLFTVRIAPAMVEHESSEPRLIGCRAY